MISSWKASKSTDGESGMKGLTKSTNVFTIKEDHGRRWMYVATEGKEWDLGFSIISILRGHWVSCLCVCVCVLVKSVGRKKTRLYIK